MDVFVERYGMTFDEIVSTYQKKIFGVAYRILRNRQDAEDATQETLLKLFKKSDTYRNNSSLKTWICAMARNAAIDMRRRKNPIDFTDDNYDFERALSISPGASYEAALQLEYIIRRLRVRDLETLLPYAYGGEQRELAEYLGIPEGTVKSRIYRLQEKMRDEHLLRRRGRSVSAKRVNKIISAFLEHTGRNNGHHKPD